MTPDATKFAEVRRELQRAHGISVSEPPFDARAIASSAVQTKGALWGLLARRVPGYEATASPEPEARDEALAACSFFHESPAKYRQSVAKSGIVAVLRQHDGGVERAALYDHAARLLRLSRPCQLVERAVRDLEREGKLQIDAGLVRATSALTSAARGALTIATHDQDALRARCVTILEPQVPKGRHHRGEAARRVGQTLEVDAPIHGMLETLAREIAGDPFAKSLAAAELFMRLTEHDAHEHQQALAVSDRVTIDTSIALPMICACYDEPVADWPTSAAALDLHALLLDRGVRCVLPSVYLEEVAAHLLNARGFADIVEEEDLERSKNYFVAHYCSKRPLDGAGRSRADFLAFLGDFGARPALGESWVDERRRAERALRDIFLRYGFVVESIDQRDDDPRLRDEPPRDALLLQHDRAVVRTLRDWAGKSGKPWLVCTADGWLRGVFNDLEIVALDGVGLVDLLSLVRSSSTRSEPLNSPLELASMLGEQEREEAAQVWDTIVKFDAARPTDRELLRKARSFRESWLARPDDNVEEAWRRHRDGAP